MVSTMSIAVSYAPRKCGVLCSLFEGIVCMHVVAMLCRPTVSSLKVWVYQGAIEPVMHAMTGFWQTCWKN